MNENEELIDQHVPSSDRDPGDDSSDSDSQRNRSTSCSSDENQFTLNGRVILPPYDDFDDKCAPSGQSTIYSLDSATKQLLTMACANVTNAKSAQCTVSSCGTCEVCRAKSQLEERSRTITFSRLTYNMNEFDQSFRVAEDLLVRRKRHNWCQIPRKPAPNALLAFLFRYIPFLDWIRSYDLRGDLNADLMAGLTIAVFQIPQCMGYSLLAGVPPIYGLYTSFMTPIFYAFFGTSKHASIGTFAIISLMTGSVIADLANSEDFVAGVSEIEIATVMALLIGLYHLIFFALRLGYLAQFMSEQLTSGFICASAVYVLSSQLGYITGIKSVKSSGTGPFGLIHFYQDLISKIRTESNPVEIGISIFCIVLLATWKFILAPRCERSKIRYVRWLKNLPFELLLVVAFIIISWYFQLKQTYKVSVLGDIPDGLPSFSVPAFDRIISNKLWQSCISLAIVAFAVTYSTGVTFGAKHGYEVSANQELLALSVTNIMGGFFQCLPSAASLSRSALAESVGTRSQIAGLINSGVILVVLLFLSQVLSFLPKCVLASIIAVALKSLFLKAVDFKKYVKLDRIDGSIWIVSFAAVIIFNVDLGLFLGLIYSLGTLIAKSQRPKTYMLGVVGVTNVYVPVIHYRAANELNKIKIYQFCGPLHFANVNYFKRKLAKNTKLKRKDSDGTSCHLPFAIIIDCSMFSYIDATGITALRNVVKFYEMRGVRVLLSDVSAHVRNSMAADDDFHKDVPTSKIYITTHDAVHRAQEDLKLIETLECAEEMRTDKNNPKSGTQENPFSAIDMDGTAERGSEGGGGGNKVKKKAADEEEHGLLTTDDSEQSTGHNEA